jgi:signal transduction histidine kinase
MSSIKKRVLIVDDEKHMRNSLSFIMKKLGHDPSTAGNGLEALDLIVKNQQNALPFDLIILDMAMPILSGDKLIMKMKQRGIKIPVLVITGMGDKKLVVNLMRLGCRDFIDKPFRNDVFEEHVISLLKEIDLEDAINTNEQNLQRSGEIARVAIHEINNVNTAISGITELIIDSISKEHCMYDGLKNVIEATRCAANICNDFITMDNSTETHKKSLCSIDELIRDVSAILSKVAPESIEIDTNLPDQPFLYKFDVWNFRHILLNIGFNAIDAMSNGGKLLYSFEVVENDGELTILIKVKDTGEGMDQDIIDQIFTDGFTTKNKSHGIGLAKVKQVIEQHEGTISVESEKGIGTCFNILLPF